MFGLYEFKIVKILGIAGFVAAFMIAAIITFNSGVLGGGAASGSGSSQAIDSQGAPAPEASAEAPAATPTTGSRTHVVADGDSFYTIARKYNVTISQIQQLNPNIDPQNLTAGTKLVIP
ncbi:MAG: LysM peptidoglycan-binding domain-containing protein [Actinobacteria bacterium]|nr:LysM peptidoglycan-binding domain-containing protein [Actinomycetota bacterium]MCL5883073.1 LysM peptidoglycan-binding domain-containing protein [Actinomycetota bacterium]